MQRALVVLILGVLSMLFAAACGGAEESAGVRIFFSTPQAQGNAGIPPVRQPSSQPNLPNSTQPQGTPPAQGPQAITAAGARACSLITRAEAAEALGQPVNEGRAIDAPKQNLGVMSVDINTCSYSVTNGPGQVGIETWKGSDLANVKLIATATCQGREKANLGDTACWGNKEHTSIQVFKGTSFINMYIRSAPNEAAFLNLAKKAVDKL
jgi:hypothetical protein